MLTSQLSAGMNDVKSPTNGWDGGGPPAPSTPMRAGQCALNVLAGGGGPADIGDETGAAGGGYCGRGGIGSTVAGGGGTPLPDGTPHPRPAGGRLKWRQQQWQRHQQPGGGAIELGSGSLLTIGANGTVNLGGGGPDPGYAVGGGSGDGILEAPTVIVRGILTVNGGSGSGTGNSSSPPGQPSLQPAVGRGKVAGSGSAGANINGGDALLQSNPAGGGGGAGRIRIDVAADPRTVERRHHLADQRNDLLYDWAAQLRRHRDERGPLRTSNFSSGGQSVPPIAIPIPSPYSGRKAETWTPR